MKYEKKKPPKLWMKTTKVEITLRFYGKLIHILKTLWNFCSFKVKLEIILYVLSNITMEINV